MLEMQSLEFNKLPEAMRQRFVASVRSNDWEIAPLVRQVSKSGSFVAIMFCLPVVLGFILLGCAAYGYGQLGSEDGLWQGNGRGIVYLVGCTLFFLCPLAAWRRIALQRGMPYPSGKYLYPFSLVEATSSTLEHYDLTRTAEIKSAPQRDRQGRYTGTRFIFFFNSGKRQEIVEADFDRAKALGTELARRQELVKQAAAAGDKVTLQKYDPFNEVRVGPFKMGAEMPGQFKARPLAEFHRWRFVIALLLGVAAGLAIWFGRNYYSDEAAYAAAKASHKEADYVSYIQNGHRHVQELKDALPRVAFEETRKTHSVTKIRALLKRYPDAGLDDDVKAEVHKIYADALTRFSEQAANSDQDLVPFVSKLLATLEANGNPTVQLRFTRPSADELNSMDAKLAKFASFQGKKMVPAAAWFAGENAGQREQRILGGLQKGFAAIFPSDVLQISLPAKIDPKQPVMDIAYQISGSGSAYTVTHENPNGFTPAVADNRIFVGLICKFQVNVALPDQPSGWHFDFSVLPPEHFQVDNDMRSGSSFDDNQRVSDNHFYHVMAERAFDELQGKLRNVLFRRGSDAYSKAGMARY